MTRFYSLLTVTASVALVAPFLVGAARMVGL